MVLGCPLPVRPSTSHPAHHTQQDIPCSEDPRVCTLRSSYHLVLQSSDLIEGLENVPQNSLFLHQHKLEEHEVLYSETNEYEVLEFLGSGTFGQVVKCVNKGTSEKVAIKMLKNHRYVTEDAEAEINILTQLNKECPDKFNVIKAYEFFLYNNIICLVFEMLHMSLFDYMESFGGSFPVKMIRPIVAQVAFALTKLKSLGIIHTDLKPDNIMLVDNFMHPLKVKVIDFGCAFHVSKARCSSYIQARFYRSPEIILGYPFCEAIDMWSLGCITAELFIGCTLYPGASEYDQIRYITETQGLPNENMLNRGTKTHLFFRRKMHYQQVLWRLKSKDHYEWETGIKPLERRINIFSCLDDFAKLHVQYEPEISGIMVEMGDMWQCLDLIKEMLALEPEKRITPIELLSHPFITMAHLTHFSQSPYVESCLEDMEICKCQLTQDETMKVEETCEDSMEDVVHDTQERPSQSEKETSDEDIIKHLSDLNDGDRVENEETNQRKRGSRLKRALRALRCRFSNTDSSTEKEAAASIHSSRPSKRSAGLLQKCVSGLSQIKRRWKQRNRTVHPLP
ncbi:Homeodomain-interacting kinase 2 [Pelobates cultripes]|uniref:Homeodomain-interacting kinase 2, partial n=1 Tax=Pelobates cultripes TaxID=61616 RepID=A0AAD1SBH1_PELCU|nr:Homeodomain-interacting kinase 2 [Pelobates cultripes]